MSQNPLTTSTTQPITTRTRSAEIGSNKEVTPGPPLHILKRHSQDSKGRGRKEKKRRKKEKKRNITCTKPPDFMLFATRFWYIRLDWVFRIFLGANTTRLWIEWTPMYQIRNAQQSWKVSTGRGEGGKGEAFHSKNLFLPHIPQKQISRSSGYCMGYLILDHPVYIAPK